MNDGKLSLEQPMILHAGQEATTSVVQDINSRVGSAETAEPIQMPFEG